MPEIPFSHAIRVSDVPAAGRKLRLSANADERACLAGKLGVAAIERLDAEIELLPLDESALRVRGTLDSDLVQTCIVTLDPVRQTVHETFDLVFLPEERRSDDGAKTVLLDPMDDEDRDYYRDGRLDLGPIVAEHLALGLDPYPRQPGTDFPAHIEDDTSDRVSPFESLRQLKDRDH